MKAAQKTAVAAEEDKLMGYYSVTLHYLRGTFVKINIYLILCTKARVLLAFNSATVRQHPGPRAIVGSARRGAL